MGSDLNQIKITPGNRLAAFIEDQKYLFWWIPENKLTELSIDAIIEAVLNHGDEKSVRYLFDILGVEKVAESL